MVTNSLLCYFSVLLLLYHSVSSVELTFDLPDSARDCFHEDIKKNTSVILEYQVSNTESVLLHFGVMHSGIMGLFSHDKV